MIQVFAFEKNVSSFTTIFTKKNASLFLLHVVFLWMVGMITLKNLLTLLSSPPLILHTRHIHVRFVMRGKSSTLLQFETSKNQPSNQPINQPKKQTNN